MERLRKSEFDAFEKSDLTFIKLLLPSEGFQTGSGGLVEARSINMLKVVEEFDKNLSAVVDAIRLGTEMPDVFPVPDLWHVTKGRAKYLPNDEGDQLWNACVFAIRVGNTFYGEKGVSGFDKESWELLNNHPGVIFKKPLEQPNFVEE